MWAGNMTQTTFILKNLWNRPVRTILTIVGLSIGIAAVIALMGIAWGFEQSFLKLYRSKGIDLVVVRAGVSNQLSGNLDASLHDKLKSFSGVSDVAGSLVDTVSFEDARLVGVVINGWEPDGLLMRGLRIMQGRALQPGDGKAAMLGKVLASSLDKKTDDLLDVAGESFRVVGVFDSDSPFEAGSLIVPIATLQKMMGRQGQVTAFVIATNRPDEEGAVKGIAKLIERKIPGVSVTTSRDFVTQDLQIRLAKAMAWATSIVALVIGSVGVLNTMFMSVYERTSEIGTLRALGWRRRRVLTIILGESLALGVIAAFLGMILAFGFIRLLMLSPTSRNFISPYLPLPVLGIGFAMGIGLSLIGGIYPAVRSAMLRPTEALRHG